MGLRTFKTWLKRTNAADREAREISIFASEDRVRFGCADAWQDEVQYALAISRNNYCRMKRAYRSLTKRQQKRIMSTLNADRKLRKTSDRLRGW